MNAKFKELINSNQLILVDFYADWCGPCKMMSPILQEVKGIIKDDVKIIKINVDQHQDYSLMLLHIVHCLPVQRTD